ncbi:MAG: hypothetical protein ABJI96_08945 [Paracoccaceae bacterium]
MRVCDQLPENGRLALRRVEFLGVDDLEVLMPVFPLLPDRRADRHGGMPDRQHGAMILALPPSHIRNRNAVPKTLQNNQRFHMLRPTTPTTRPRHNIDTVNKILEISVDCNAPKLVRITAASRSWCHFE